MGEAGQARLYISSTSRRMGSTRSWRINSKLGLAAGFCYIENNGAWVLENLTRKDHIRGALKAYRKDCFLEIGKLKKSMGWDTVDELLAKYYGWQILTDETLKVKHLKPTGANYNKASKYLQGEAMYKMRYGFVITLASALKLAFRKKSYSLFLDYMNGYFKAKKNRSNFLVTDDQGVFIRKLRWQGIKKRGCQLGCTLSRPFFNTSHIDRRRHSMICGPTTVSSRLACTYGHNGLWVGSQVARPDAIPHLVRDAKAG